MSNVYQMVTDRIIELLQQGTVPWEQPWVSLYSRAHNRISGKAYSLLNQLLLRHDGEYATYNQWASLGGHVRKGEKSEFVVFWKPGEVPVSEEKGKISITDAPPPRPVLRFYRVFHVSQVEGVQPLDCERALYQTQPLEAGELIFRSFIDSEGITLQEDPSLQPCYVPATDTICMPELAQFVSAEEYYSTAFHEAVHSTGHECRLKRNGLKQDSYGTEIYSKEELIAEVGSACIMQSLGIGTNSTLHNSAMYCHSWIEALRGDDRMIVSAASQAEKAASLILATGLL